MKSTKIPKESFILEDDVTLCCVPAKRFPEGIQQAHEKLRALLPSTQGRNFFGISYSTGKGKIVYKAGVEQRHDTEAAELGCEVFKLKKGSYSAKLCHPIDDLQQISSAFRELLADPRLDPEGCCVEVYLNDGDVRCMVRVLK